MSDSPDNRQDPLTLFRKLTSNTVQSSFLVNSKDWAGAMVYNRSNLNVANLSTQLGFGANASGNRSTAIGAFALASEDSAFAGGVYAQARGASSIAIGDQARGSTFRSIAIGSQCNVSGIRGIGIGSQVNVSHQDSIVVGNNSFSTRTGQVVLGSASQTVSQVYLGRGVTHIGAAQTVQIHVTDGVGTNVAGDTMALYPGAGTGSGAGGNLEVYRPIVGGSGTTLQSQQLFMRLRPDGLLVLTQDGVIPTGISGTGIWSHDAAGNYAAIAISSGDTNASVLSFSCLAGTECAIAANRIAAGVFNPLNFYTSNTVQMAILASGCVQVNNGAVADTGAGTINVKTNVYKDGMAYINPDYVLEHYFTGKSDHPEYPGLMNLKKVLELAQEDHYLPQLDYMKLHDSPAGIFDMADMSLLLHEETFIHLRNLEKRIESLERNHA